MSSKKGDEISKSTCARLAQPRYTHVGFQPFTQDQGRDAPNPASGEKRATPPTLGGPGGPSIRLSMQMQFTAASAAASLVAAG